MSSAPTVGGYSFYLNVVVIASGYRDDDLESSQGESPAGEETTVPATVDNEIENGSPSSSNTSTLVDPKLKLLLEGKSLMESVLFSPKLQRNKLSSKPEAAPKLVQDGQRLMRGIGSAVSKSSHKISQRASRFVANKTMVTRAEKAVVGCIPVVTEEMGVELSISKRFQQGPVFVLEVDMKGCDLLMLLETVLGSEAALKYRNVMEGFESLQCPESMETFVNEMLPKVRKGMMEKLAEAVPQTMKKANNNSSNDLEIQCVALEDSEEAKWLYNFLAFMEEMK